MKISTFNQINTPGKNFSTGTKQNNITNTTNSDLLGYLSATPASLSFMSTRRIPLKSLELQNENAIKIISNIKEKLNKYNSNGIRGNFLKPFSIKTENANYLVLLNNSDPKITKIEIKNQINSNEDFNILQDNQSRLKLAIDEKGKIIDGSLSKKINDKFTKRFELQKVSENINRIKTNEGFVLQNSRTKDKLTTKPDLCKYKESKEFDIHKDFTEFDSGLSEIFFRFMQGRSMNV